MAKDRVLVIDIFRSSVNDGPGIRTTIFTKGCPLRCTWCHNPESQSTRPELSFDAEKCIHCGACEDTCLHDVHRVLEHSHAVERLHCTTCGRCVRSCPVGGLKVVGEEWAPCDLVALAMRDKPYFDRSGGGLTISGGEPMSQFQPVMETLRLAREAGIHTCLDTCGQAPLSHYFQILPHVSLFLWDVKATGAELHRDLTGVDGVQIDRNLHGLYAAGAKIRLRCPMVPGVNDQPAHLSRIAQLSEEMPDLDGIDIMPYHSLARDKAEKVGMSQDGLPAESATNEQTQRWLTALARLGCERVTAG